MVAADGDLVGLFVHPAAVGLGHAGKGAGDVVVPPHVLHQVLGHGGQAVGVLDVPASGARYFSQSRLNVWRQSKLYAFYNKKYP